MREESPAAPCTILRSRSMTERESRNADGRGRHSMPTGSAMQSCPTLAPKSFPALWGANTTSASSGDGNSSSVMHIFRDVWASADGLIVQRNDCTAVRNGGCAHHMHKPWAPSEKARTYRRLVTLAMHYGDAHYHFPIEVLAGFAKAEALLLPSSATSHRHYSIALHVTRRTDFVMQWLHLVGMNSSVRVVDGDVYASQLFVPRPGRCGKPSLHEIAWLRRRLFDALQIPKSPKSSSADVLLLIQRANISASSINLRRAIPNFEQLVRRPAEDYARKHGLRFVLHSDANLPPVHTQLRGFSRAKVVVAPYGAGEVGLLAAPRGTCLVELADPMRVDKNGHAHAKNSEYALLSRFLGHLYLSVPTPGLHVDVAKLRSTIDKCPR
jgi:hypothetical protein